MKIYQVGGSVRDKLMQRTPHDTDYVVTGASVEQMQQLGYRQVGKHFPVFIEPSSGDEYALARKEIKIGSKHTDFKFIFDSSITLADDLERRDFTCNAIALDKDSGKIIDYHHGQKDIENKILRHVNSQHFSEDPLRVLRMCRFAAQLGFTIAPETMLLAQKMVNQNMLSYLSAERIWQEFYKALQSEYFDKFITAMRECGALKSILPEIDKMFSTPENLETHPEGNVGEHTILSVKQVSHCTPKVKFATFLHDVGKIVTPTKQIPNHKGHEATGIQIINKICQRLKVPNDIKNFAKISCQYHGYFYHILELSIEDLYETVSALYKYNTDDLINVFRADYFGRLLKKDTQIQKTKEDFFRKALNIFKNIKATDMPDFSKLPKDKSFFLKYREFKIDVLRQSLDNKNNSKEN